MVVLALVLIVAALVVGTAGALARAHRLPRNRVLGVRTAWTMSSVDAFRRANRVAAPLFLASGAVGLAGGLAALFSAGTGAALTMVISGAAGLVVLLGMAGVLGARFAESDEKEARGPALSGPCSMGQVDEDDEPEVCATPTGACGGACSLCPHGSSAAPS